MPEIKTTGIELKILPRKIKPLAWILILLECLPIRKEDYCGVSK